MKRKRSDQTKLIEHVFIDGYPPKNPKPQLSFLQPPQASVGRQLSSDFQGMLNMLIDQAYPPNACPSCFEVFTARSEAKEHFKEQHRGEKTYQCLAHNCEQSYSSKPGLRYHLLNGHQATLVSDKE
ncbi:hypothetical protein G6F57_011899 [Rhizopus arrhizus]|jgi:hypothetical protein|uniref:C2H2-type domain-containing protein n=4 Tax=Rhizopus TaxID=4842 RepID=I1C7H6_RHIO9|nr:hypothetical protein RO3G_09116 [Rhizopus delemar RA 99-880]KAG0766985.1 hypothetical protein G6F24_003166 [Rhizopus arrhizus]KAG1053488.1 hypothetical protein G6F43_004441 [Rhizopus delemar]KAG0784152.1 hypothetical protein G6F22_008416 [Rhizopus arrhizus]KAG0787191.1 hypothetical protein G6F21_008074 [Rhizopus arrhizus]|eukprot:EIE84406.1 hypothetical protein RO3G_09116 [Rhizopus delemar RA 99-880]